MHCPPLALISLACASVGLPEIQFGTPLDLHLPDYAEIIKTWPVAPQPVEGLLAAVYLWDRVHPIGLIRDQLMTGHEWMGRGFSGQQLVRIVCSWFS